MNKLVTVVKRYWIAEETNIFKNYRDAIMGLVSLIIIPLFSICLVFAVEEYTFWNYSFPLISISWAGVYDCFGRFETKSPKNPKLVVHMVFNGISIFFSILCPGVSHTYLPIVSPSLLFLCGLFLFFEIYNQIKYAISISFYNF